MIFKKIGKSLINWWNKPNITAEELWLSQSADVVELENKLRQLWNPNWYNYRNIGGL